MNLFGLHTFAIAPVWDLARIEPQIDRLKEFGIGLLEVPLLRPEEIDVKRSRAFANRHGVELLCSLGLPRSLDVVERPDEALDFLAPAFKVSAEVGSEMLGGVTYGTIGKTTGRGPSFVRGQRCCGTTRTSTWRPKWSSPTCGERCARAMPSLKNLTSGALSASLRPTQPK